MVYLVNRLIKYSLIKLLYVNLYYKIYYRIYSDKLQKENLK